MIDSNEIEIIGKWIEVPGGVDGDTNCKRVQELTRGYLTNLGTSPESGGWETLFRDPEDGRFWEQVYSESHMHGGGPPSLFVLDEKVARAKYPASFE